MTCNEMIDATGFKLLLGHLQNNPDIHTIIQVFDGVDLATVSEEFKKEDEVRQIQVWMNENKLDVYAVNKGNGIGRNIKVKEVLETQAVDCLYLPPFYLFKDRNQKWI